MHSTLGKVETTLHELYAVFQYESFIPIGLPKYLQYLESQHYITIKRKPEVKGWSILRSPEE